jgi:hypothetical protein
MYFTVIPLNLDEAILSTTMFLVIIPSRALSSSNCIPQEALKGLDRGVMECQDKKYIQTGLDEVEWRVVERSAEKGQVHLHPLSGFAKAVKSEADRGCLRDRLRASRRASC